MVSRGTLIHSFPVARAHSSPCESSYVSRETSTGMVRRMTEGSFSSFASRMKSDGLATVHTRS